MTSNMYTEASDLLPYRCPSCGSGIRFRSLVALRMHMSVMHSLPSPQNKSLSSNKNGLQSTDKENGHKNKWEEMLVSNTTVDDVFNKYSARMDNILTNYDRDSLQLEKQVKFVKQLGEIKKQKEELQRMKTSWKATHGVSQLIKDTDELINRSVQQADSLSGNQKEYEKEINGSQKTTSGEHSSKDLELQRQVQLSIELASKYKAKAKEAESKLKDKETEEIQMKNYIDHVAKKEAVARQKLAVFMEELLERAECAEEELESFKSISNYPDSLNLSSSTRRKSCGDSNLHSPRSSIKNQRQRSNTVDLPPHPLSSTTKNAPTRRSSKKHARNHDPYVDEVVEPPSSQELPRRADRLSSKHKQLQGINTSRLFDGSKLMPFSNAYQKSAQHTPHSSENRDLVLFFVFAHLNSAELLRCSLVCREWREAARSPQLWSRIVLQDVYVDPLLLHSISRWSTETCLISLRNVEDMNAQNSTMGTLEAGLESVLKSCNSNLLVISIEDCDPGITSRSMWLLTCHNKNVKSVTYRSQIDPISYQVAWAMGTACRDIVSLEVAPRQPCTSPHIFNNNVARLMSWCWPHLQAISFGGIAIDGAAMLAVALNCHRLKILELDHAKGVTEDIAHSVCQHGLRELQTLLFTHTPVVAATLQLFLDNCPLRLLKVTLTQHDFFPKKSKSRKLSPEYQKLQNSFAKLQKRPEYRRVLQIQYT